MKESYSECKYGIIIGCFRDCYCTNKLHDKSFCNYEKFQLKCPHFSRSEISSIEMKKIEIEVPEGKTAKWIDGVLKLVDEETKDTRPITERIKTFEDACKELGEDHALVKQWVRFSNSIMADMDETGSNLSSYMKLRIICAALNEGWKPQFTKDEYRYYPWFRLYDKEEIDNMDEHKRKKLVLYHGNALAYACSGAVHSHMYTDFGSQVCLNTYDLSEYCGKQFIDIWAGFCFN